MVWRDRRTFFHLWSEDEDEKIEYKPWRTLWAFISVTLKNDQITEHLTVWRSVHPPSDKRFSPCSRVCSVQQGRTITYREYTMTAIQRFVLQLSYMLINLYERLNQKCWKQKQREMSCRVGSDRISDVPFDHSGIRVPSGSRPCCSALSSWWVLLFSTSTGYNRLPASGGSRVMMMSSFMRYERWRWFWFIISSDCWRVHTSPKQTQIHDLSSQFSAGCNKACSII